METFGYGVDDEHITATDADGVALAAIQALNAKVESYERQLAIMQAQMAALEARLERK